MLLVIELGSDVMQNIVCNTKSIVFVTVITIPCKTIRKKKNDNKKKVMQKFLEFFYHLTCHWLIWWFKWLGSFDWILSDSGYLPPGHERLRKSGSLAGDVKAGREVFADISSYLFQK